MSLRPCSYGVKTPAFMSGIEVNVRLCKRGRGWLEPDLSQNTNIDATHELLSNYVEAVGWKIRRLEDIEEKRANPIMHEASN